MCSLRSNWQYVSIGSDNGLAPFRRQAIIWTNADLVHWRIHAALGGDQLMQLVDRHPIPRVESKNFYLLNLVYLRRNDKVVIVFKHSFDAIIITDKVITPFQHCFDAIIMHVLRSVSAGHLRRR